MLSCLPVARERVSCRTFSSTALEKEILYVTAGGPVTSGGIAGPKNLHMPLAPTVPSAASLALAPDRRPIVGPSRRVSAAAASDTQAEGLVNWLRESGLRAQKVPRQPFLSCKLFCSSLGGPKEAHLCINVTGFL